MRENHINMSKTICALLGDWYSKQTPSPSGTNPTPPPELKKEPRKLETKTEVETYLATIKNPKFAGAVRAKLLADLEKNGHVLVPA